MIKHLLLWLYFLWLPFLSKAQPLEFVMDMVHNNPGEKTYDTKYNDPAYLKSEGFNAIVPQWFVNCAIAYHTGIADTSAESQWIQAKAAWIDRKIPACKNAGLAIYPFTDFLVFPRSVWEKWGDSLRRPGTTGNVPDIRRPLTQQLVKTQIEGIFQRFPGLDGLVLRFGETYLFDTPFHLGASPLRSGNDGIADHILFLNILREELCVKRNKKLFYRTWDFGYNFHNNPQYYLAVTNVIPPHLNLIFSAKYTQDDFLRMTAFNPTLGIGRHRQIVEAQSAMEAYGKGSHPYYTAQGVLEGFPETKWEISFGTGAFTGKLNDPQKPRGVKDVANNKLLCGMWTWSKGGGWQGPYVSNDIWNDLNTYVNSHWAQNTSRREEDLFREFAATKGITGRAADCFRQICLLSIEAVRKGQCNSFTINDKWWARDEFFSAAANRATCREIVANNLQQKVLSEKAEAVAMWRQIVSLSQQLAVPDSATAEAIRVSSTYGRIKYELSEQMWVLMIADAEYDSTHQRNTAAIAKAIRQYDALWQKWRQLKQSSRQCATLYTDLAFRNKKEGSIGELVDRLRIAIAGSQ